MEISNFAKETRYNPQTIIVMCKISEDTILKANARMKSYKIGQGERKVVSKSFTVDTRVNGRVYSNTFTEEKVNAIFSRALTNMEARNGKAL